MHSKDNLWLYNSRFFKADGPDHQAQVTVHLTNLMFSIYLIIDLGSKKTTHFKSSRYKFNGQDGLMIQL